MVLASMDELGVGAEAHVVEEDVAADAADVDPALPSAEGIEGGDGIRVEAQVAREVVPRARWDADERQPALDRDLRDARERAVPACDSQGVGLGGPRELRRVLALAKDVRVDPALGRRGAKIVRARRSVPRARVDQEEAAYPVPFSERPSWRSSAPLGWAPSAAAAGSPSLKSTIVGIDAMP
jgi:hypothetical protein